jgi:hypothetical protein
VRHAQIQDLRQVFIRYTPILNETHCMACRLMDMRRYIAFGLLVARAAVRIPLRRSDCAAAAIPAGAIPTERLNWLWPNPGYSTLYLCNAPTSHSVVHLSYCRCYLAAAPELARLAVACSEFLDQTESIRSLTSDSKLKHLLHIHSDLPSKAHKRTCAPISCAESVSCLPAIVK